MPVDAINHFVHNIYSCVAIYLVATVYLIRQWMTTHRKCTTDLKKRSGQVAVVTGGTRGIGLEIVKQLMHLEMHVIMACRKPNDSITLLKKLSSAYPDGKVEAMELDLCSLSSVRQFSEKFQATGLPLHLLVNNAGIMLTPYSLTVDGYESQLQVNYLSHFLLTNLLLPNLKKTGSSECYARIVNVSSCAAFPGIINFDDLQSKKNYSPHGCYAQSKLAQIMFTWSLQEQFHDEGSYITVNTLHPGVIYSQLYAHVKFFQIAPVLLKFLTKTPAQGADAVLHAGCSLKTEGMGGKYFVNCDERDPPQLVLNQEIRRRLWRETASLVNLNL